MAKKTALISGATAGIGQATAREFAKNGWDLLLTGRRIERLVQLKQELISHFQVNIQTYCFDIRESEECQKAVEAMPTKIDLLVNNAGLSQGLDPIQTGSLKDWETMIDTNVKGLLYLSKAVIDRMKENGTGHIVNVGSIAGKEVYPNGNVYCATKHAVDALTKAMRVDLVKLGIKVSAIHPGMVDTEFSLVRFKGDQEKADKVYQGFEPLHAQDIAETIYFMASRPAHVNIDDLLIMPTVQASATIVNKEG